MEDRTYESLRGAGEPGGYENLKSMRTDGKHEEGGSAGVTQIQLLVTQEQYVGTEV